MATELGLLSSAQVQKLAHQSQQNKPSPSAAAAWMLNPKQAHTHEDDDSWELRAFAEDTGDIMGTTWPPRSYTCTFCRREFRSAQALGGHMNVHRRDRARLRYQSQLRPPPPAFSSSTSNGGYCLLYQLPNPNGAFTPTTVTACAIESPTTTTLLSISPCTPANFPVPPTTHVLSTSTNNNNNESAIEEVDLELRLGHRPTPT